MKGTALTGGVLFQFLIGIINPGRKFWYSYWLSVSIPHRYYKSTPPLHRIYSTKPVSIPHRYYKSVKYAEEFGKGTMFQFLIGIINR